MNVLMQLWGAVVVSVAVIVLVVTAIGMMVGLVEQPHALRRIARTLGCMVALLMLPPITLGIWRTLTLWQRLGLLILLAISVTFMSRRTFKKANPDQPRH